MLSYNIEGFRRNKHYLSDLILKHSPKVIFLQEIWLPFHDLNALNSFHPEYTFEISTPDMFQHPEDLLNKPGHVWHGVAIGWKKTITGSITVIESTYERVVGVRFSLTKTSIIFVSFYAPTAGQVEDNLESLSPVSIPSAEHLYW